MTAAVDFVEIDEIAIGMLGPALRRLVELAREHRHRNGKRRGALVRLVVPFARDHHYSGAEHRGLLGSTTLFPSPIGARIASVELRSRAADFLRRGCDRVKPAQQKRLGGTSSVANLVIQRNWADCAISDLDRWAGGTRASLFGQCSRAGGLWRFLHNRFRPSAVRGNLSTTTMVICLSSRRLVGNIGGGT